MTRDTISAEEILHKAHAVGQYYGFTPLSAITLKARGARKPAVYPESLAGVSIDSSAEIVAGFLKHVQNIEAVPNPRQPLFIWHTNIAPGRPAQKKAIVQFHALGSDRAIADVVVIRALLALVRDIFHEEPVLRINSMGDKETRARYARELGNFFKKRAAILPEECVNCAKRDTFEAAELAIANEYADDLPAPTEQLSDASRKRFEDLLEYLEMTETPYELARNLISRGNVWNDTCFEVSAAGRTLAWGSRYSDFTRHFFPKAPFNATCAILQLPTEGKVVKNPPQPRLRFTFVHIGDEAKRLSIRLAEDFKKAHVPIVQNIGIESLTEQLHLAETRANPYLLIMGRKEALEGSAILRNRQTQEETMLPIANLAERLRTFA
ncbi:MAG: His/Gly/Thr/Pro-type tRNA ligase C-terminal domain-containing protein [Minisyncoccia bacterium]